MDSEIEYKEKAEEITKKISKLKEAEGEQDEMVEMVADVRDEVENLEEDIGKRREELKELDTKMNSQQKKNLGLQEKTDLAKALENEISQLKKEIRKLEQECSRSRSSTRIEEAKLQNASVNLQKKTSKDEKRRRQTHQSIDMEKMEIQELVGKLKLLKISAEKTLESAKKGKATEDIIRKEIDRLKSATYEKPQFAMTKDPVQTSNPLSREGELVEEKQQENGIAPPTSSPPAKLTISDRDTGLTTAVKREILKKLLDIQQALRKTTAENIGEEQLNSLCSSEDNVLLSRPLMRAMRVHFGDGVKIDVSKIKEALEAVKAITETGSLQALSLRSRLLIISNMITIPSEEIPSLSSVLQMVSKASQPEIQSLLEDTTEEKLKDDIETSIKKYLDWSPDIVSVSRQPSTQESQSVIEEEDGWLALMQASQPVVDMEDVLDDLESFGEETFQNASEVGVEDEASAANSGFTFEISKDRILEQAQRNARRLANLVPLQEDGKVLEYDLNAFLADDDTKPKYNFAYQRKHLGYIVPMTIRAILLYHAFQGEDDKKVESCLAHALAVFKVTNKQLSPIWEEIEIGGSYRNQKGKEVFLEEMKRQVQLETGVSKMGTEKLIKHLQLELRDIQRDLDEKKKIAEEEKKKNEPKIKVIAEKVNDCFPLSFFCGGCRSAESRRRQKEEKRKKEYEERRKKRLQEAIELEKREEAERKRKRDEARKKLFDGIKVKDHAEEKGLDRIPPLNSEEILTAYHILYLTLLEYDNALATRSFREFENLESKKHKFSTETLGQNTNPSLTDVSKSILNRFSLVYGVHSVSRYIHSIKFTFRHLNIRNICFILNEIHDGISILEAGYAKVTKEDVDDHKGNIRQKKHSRSFKSENDIEPDDYKPLPLPRYFKRSHTMDLLNSIRPIGLSWDENHKHDFIVHIVRAFQLSVWCLTRYHIAFANERKFGVDSKTEGMKACLKLLQKSYTLIASHSEISLPILVEDEKHSMGAAKVFNAYAGYDKNQDRPFFVSSTPTFGNKWSELLKRPLKYIFEESVKFAAHETWNDFVALTQPPDIIVGDLTVAIGKVNFQIRTDVQKLSYAISVGGSSQRGPVVRMGKTGDFKLSKRILKNISLHTPLVIEIIEDNLFNNKLVDTITLNLFQIYRDKDQPKDVKLEDVTLEEDSSQSQLISPKNKKIDITLSNDGVEFKHHDTYALGHPKKRDILVGTVEVELSFKEEKNEERKLSRSSKDTSENRDKSSSALHDSSSLAAVANITDVDDAPQLVSVFIAIIQEFESDVKTQKDLQSELKEMKLQFLNLSMEEYFKSSRVALQLLLRKVEFQESERGIEGGEVAVHFSTQMLELYRSAKKFLEMLENEGLDIAGASQIEPLFGTYVRNWIADKKNLIRVTSIPTLFDHMKFAIVSSDYRHAWDVVDLFTLMNNIKSYFLKSIPYTKANYPELMQMFASVVTDYLLPQFNRRLEREYKTISEKKSRFGWGVEGKIHGRDAKLTTTVPDSVPVILNTARITVGELVKFFRRAHDKETDAKGDRKSEGVIKLENEEKPIRLNFDDEEIREAFDYFKATDLLKKMIGQLDAMCDRLAKLICKTPMRTLRGVLKKITKGKTTVTRISDDSCFKATSLYLNTFFFSWAKTMYPNVFKQVASHCLENLLGSEMGLERLLLDAIRDRPPNNYIDQATLLSPLAQHYAEYFGKNGLDIGEKAFNKLQEVFSRLQSIFSVITQPSSELMKGGGLEKKKTVAIGKLEEFRKKNKPHIFRETVLQLLKYRFYRMNNDAKDEIPFSFIKANDLKKGFFGWD